jgi:peptide deformylase
VGTVIVKQDYRLKNMILPIRAFGDAVLRKKCKKIDEDHQGLDMLIANMFETMYNASGVGLAAPQIGLNLRLFIIDARGFAEDEDYIDVADELAEFKKVFINPKIIKEEGEEWKFSEGCLSIPNIREDVARKPTLEIEYYNEKWELKREVFSDIRARVVQHEYDHIEGKLFTDYLTGLKKRLIKSKLNNISKGKVDVDYKMRFPLKK